MQDIRIDGRTHRVFVLTKSDKRIVYIPVKSLHRTDYDRLCQLEKQDGDLLKVMQKTKLDNGRNALELYDDIIQVLDLTKGNHRLPKPDEAMFGEAAPQSEPAKTSEEKPQQAEKKEETAEEPKKRGRRGPGRPRKSETAQ